MCYSAQSSFITFGIGTALIIALLSRGLSIDKWNATFIFPIILMQLLEGGMWLDLDNKKGINNFMSKLVPIVIAMQPIGQMYGSLFQHPEFKYIAYIVTLISLFAGFGAAFEVGNKFSTPGANGFLDWPISVSNWYSPFFFFFLIAPMLAMKPTIQGIIQFVLALICIGIAKAQAPIAGFGSNWCWLTVYFTLSAYLIPTIITK